MKLISVIIPCFNYGWLLAETLDSVLAQTYAHWECIIIDDGSTDDTCAVTKRYQRQDSRFQYAYQSNKGISAARNHGLRLAQGEYIQLLDADDLLASSKLSTQAAYLDAHSEVDIIYGDVRFFRHGEPNTLSRSFDMKDTPWMTGVQGEGEKVLSTLMKRNIMVTPAPLIRVTLLKGVEPFAEDLRSMEDWEFWVRCALAGAYFHYDDVPQTWTMVRVHSTSTSQNIIKMYKGEVQARHRLQQLLEEKEAVVAAKLNKMGMESIINGISDIAKQKIVEGKLWVGIQDYFYLAFITKKYGYYSKSIIYWLKMRNTTSLK